MKEHKNRDENKCKISCAKVEMLKSERTNYVELKMHLHFPHINKTFALRDCFCNSWRLSLTSLRRYYIE